MHYACGPSIIISIKSPFATICFDTEVEVKQKFESKSKIISDATAEHVEGASMTFLLHMQLHVFYVAKLYFWKFNTMNFAFSFIKS